MIGSDRHMGEYRVKVSIRNNLLLSAIEAAGYSGWGGITRFCSDAGADSTKVSALLSMRDPPVTKDGEFSVTAKAIMEILGAAPSDLWTDAQLTMRLRRNSAETTMGQSEVSALLESHIEAMTLPSPEDIVDAATRLRAVEDALCTLTKRESKTLRLRFGVGCQEKTSDETGEALGVSGARARKIEQVALRKLRLPDRQAIINGTPMKAEE